MPGSESQMLRCMAHAEALAKSASDWTAIAKIGTLELRDSDLAQLCLSNAQATAEDSDDWRQIAEVCTELGFDEIAQRCRDISTVLAPQEAVYDLPSVVKPDSENERVLYVQATVSSQWGRGDYEQALICVAEAEAASRSPRGWTSIARTWAHVLYDKQNAYRCMAQAEIFAEYFENSSDWVVVAENWASILHDKNSAIRCLKQAESVVRYSIDWTNIARNWMAMFHDRSNAFRCLEEATHVAWSPSDWTDIAQSWLNIFCDREKAVSFAKRFESTIVMYPSAYEWDTLANLWARLGYVEEAKAARQKANSPSRQ